MPFIWTIDKRSKKAQKEYYSKLRGTWGELNPVTRSVPSGKTYNRNKDKKERRRIGREFSDGFAVDFCYYVPTVEMLQMFHIDFNAKDVTGRYADIA